MPIFLGFLSYLILKHQAFDIKVIAAQFLVVTVWIAVFSQFFIVQERSNQILTAVTLALVTYFGWMLFKAVKEEVRTGQQLHLAGRKLAGLNAKLEELDRAKSEFISIASHQLRTPLTSVKGFTSLILDNTFGKIPIGQKKSVEKIFVNNEKLCLLVEDMLNASRLEAGRLEYELEEADLVSVVKSTVDIISLYAKSKKIKLIVNYPKEKALYSIVDQRKVSEIISNLIDNAIKYTPKGSVTVTLEKFKKATKVGKMKNTGTVNGHWARVSVTDTGIGMSEKQAEEIFEKFKEGSSDVKNNKKEESLKPVKDDKTKNGNGNNMTTGTGLGVYISRQMAQAMGGQLHATSPGKNKGSTFILELPLVKK
jgi:signal transduction histidine kinase